MAKRWEARYKNKTGQWIILDNETHEKGDTNVIAHVLTSLDEEVDSEIAHLMAASIQLRESLIMCRNVIETTLEKGELPDYVGEVAIEHADNAIKKAKRK